MNHVVCVKWGNKYPSQYANVLNNMVKRHTTVPFQFHCLTDDPTGLDPDINVIKLPNDPWIKSWWSKLMDVAPEMPLKGNILFFDLDVVIFDNIDPLFTHNPGKFNIIRDFNRCRVKDWKLSNSSCMRWEAGTMDYLWNEFKEISKDHATESGRPGLDNQRGQGQITHWFPDEWIRSYKWELIGSRTQTTDQGRQEMVQRTSQNKPGNRVAVFHGSPNPMECADQWVVDNWK